MALIPCPECNKEISDKAKSCPNCGYPFCRFWPVGERINLWGFVFICLGTLFITLEVFGIFLVRGGTLLFGLGWLMFGISLSARETERRRSRPAAFTIVVIATVIIILSIVGLIIENIR